MFDQQLTFVKKQFQTKMEAIDFLIQKAIESRRISDEQKQLLRTMKIRA